MLQQLQCRTTPLAANLLKQKPDYAHDHKNLREVPTAQSIRTTEAPPAILDEPQQLPIRDSKPEVSSLADMKQWMASVGLARPEPGRAPFVRPRSVWPQFCRNYLPGGKEKGPVHPGNSETDADGSTVVSG
jgi:hypothetical protein